MLKSIKVVNENCTFKMYYFHFENNTTKVCVKSAYTMENWRGILLQYPSKIVEVNDRQPTIDELKFYGYLLKNNFPNFKDLDV